MDAEVEDASEDLQPVKAIPVVVQLRPKSAEQLAEPAPLSLRLPEVEAVFEVAVARTSQTTGRAAAVQMASAVSGIADTATWVSASVLCHLPRL